MTTSSLVLTLAVARMSGGARASLLPTSNELPGGNAATKLLVSIPGERDSRCDRNFLVATNSHNRFCPVSVRSIAGSLSEPNLIPDAAPTYSSKDERLSRACIA